MFGIPEWAIGVGVIILFITTARIAVHMIAPDMGRGGQKLRPKDLRDNLGMLDDIQARLAELDQLKQRVTELEERVDFSERVLATKREGQRLAPPPE